MAEWNFETGHYGGGVFGVIPSGGVSFGAASFATRASPFDFNLPYSTSGGPSYYSTPEIFDSSVPASFGGSPVPRTYTSTPACSTVAQPSPAATFESTPQPSSTSAQFPSSSDATFTFPAYAGSDFSATASQSFAAPSRPADLAATLSVTAHTPAVALDAPYNFGMDSAASFSFVSALSSEGFAAEAQRRGAGRGLHQI